MIFKNRCLSDNSKAGLKQLVKKKCLDPGLNQGPSDLQSDALPTELSRLVKDSIQ